MKKIFSLLAAIAFTAVVNAQAPKGYLSGALLLADGTYQSGFVKDNLRKSATISFVSTDGSNRKTYTGSQLLGVDIDSNRYTCIRGDFFRMICEGELCFLQKASDASGQPSYNGNEAVFSSGTEGKIGDYFIYSGKTRELILVNNKNLASVAAACFKGHPSAIEKANAINGNIAQLREAVEQYNQTAD